MSKRKSRDSKSKHDPLLPLDLSKFGTDEDCFGQLYSPSAKECKICGDSELCNIKMSQSQHEVRDALQLQENYKDFENEVYDNKKVKKFLNKQLPIRLQKAYSMLLKRFNMDKEASKMFIKVNGYKVKKKKGKWTILSS